MTDLRSIFGKIYDSADWGVGSGSGSDPVRMTGYLEFLVSFMRLNDIALVLDVGCGDWRLAAYLPWGSIRYRGIDVVESLIHENRRPTARKPSSSSAPTCASSSCRATTSPS